MFGDIVSNDKAWEAKRLGEVVRVRSSKRVYQREQTDSGVPFLRVSDLTKKIIDGIDTCDLYIAEELYEGFLKGGLVPKSGDILVTSRGTLGLCYIVNDSDRFYFQDGMISWLDKRNNSIDSVYLSYLFQTNGITRQIEQVSAGSTVSYLSLGNLESIEVLVPPLALQNRFADFVRQADKSKFVAWQAIQKLKKVV
jgi:type I restriction enzyme S subunit